MNLVVIFAALVLGPWFGVYGLAWGAVAGAAAFALVQVPDLRWAGFKYRPHLDLRHPEVRRVGAMMLPVVLASGIGQVFTMIDWRLASGLAEGSIAALNYASKLMQLPQGLFVTAVTTAVFPTLSHLAAADRRPEMAETLRRAMKVVLLLAVPGAAGLMVLREPIVALLFQRGAFDARATAMTSAALLFFAVGLAGFCLNLPLTRGFFALQDTRTPLYVSLGTVPVKLFLSLALVRPLHHAGLALATSLTALANLVVLSWLLRRLPGLYERSFFTFCAGVAAASGVMGLVVALLDASLAARLGAGAGALALRVALDVSIGVLVFAAAGTLLRLDEMRYLWELARGLWKLRPGVSRSG